MPNLFAMCFEGTLAPSFDLRCLERGRKPPDGWGIGYYPGGEPSASVLKEPAPASGSIRSELVKAWDHLASSIFVIHIRTATWGQNSDANTQPFSRSYGQRDWLIGHSGSLRERLIVEGRFEPVGSTDTELIFCDLLGRFEENGWKSIGSCDLERLRTELDSLNEHGTLSIVMSDGSDLLVYADAHDEGGLYLAHLLPPFGDKLAFGDDELTVDLTKRGEINRKGVAVSSSPLPRLDGKPMEWTRVPPGHLMVVRQGAVHHDFAVSPDAPKPKNRTLRAVQPSPQRAEPRTYAVSHRTVYRYRVPVERSSHLLKLTPVFDRLQRLREHTLELKLDGAHFEGRQIDFDDVFGNRARRLIIEQPYEQLEVESRSVVELLDTDPLEFKPLHARRAIPLVWMPWQREMMAPYLLPPELPETQLQELADYAMTFVERNDYDLIGTVLDMNRSIYREYKYVQGATSVATTAFQVYVDRRGVCQDFTNLFICLARLLGVPARYSCGYVYTGPKAENTAQSEASHAWVELYLPEVGWKGFDPTNGVLTQTEHVRVAHGRSYVDATPTSGTIYVGGEGETLEVSVRVEPLAER
ncbi:MAG: class II glutamine amidotransferase [Myxococcales bacterium]|nr:class II glutamine amidotransferase [Myxococcales bacterium]